MKITSPNASPRSADDESAHQQRAPVDALEVDRAEVGQHEIGFTPRRDGRFLLDRRRGRRLQCAAGAAAAATNSENDERSPRESPARLTREQNVSNMSSSVPYRPDRGGTQKLRIVLDLNGLFKPLDRAARPRIRPGSRRPDRRRAGL